MLRTEGCIIEGGVNLNEIDCKIPIPEILSGDEVDRSTYETGEDPIPPSRPGFPDDVSS